MDLKNLPWWGKVGIAAALCLAFVFVSYRMAPLNFSQKAKRIARAEQQLEKLQAEIRKGRQARARLDELERDIAALERKLTDLRQVLPTEPELGDLLKWIKSLADQTNLDLLVFSPGSLQEGEFLLEQPIQMQVRGTYHQLGMFFDRVGKHARIINIQDVDIRPARGGSSGQATIEASFTAKTFIYKEEKAGDEGGDA